MPDAEQVVVIRGAIGATDAQCVVASLTGDVEASIEEEMIYPYYCFAANCSVPTLVGRKNISLLCLVDAVNGLGATADSFELKTEIASGDRLLDADIEAGEAAAIAQRTVTHRLGKKLRTIASFDVSVAPRGLVHKRFWIVRTREARVMVDSTNGGLHPLKLRAA